MDHSNAVETKKLAARDCTKVVPTIVRYGVVRGCTGLARDPGWPNQAGQPGRPGQSGQPGQLRWAARRAGLGLASCWLALVLFQIASQKRDLGFHMVRMRPSKTVLNFQTRIDLHFLGIVGFQPLGFLC